MVLLRRLDPRKQLERNIGRIPTMRCAAKWSFLGLLDAHALPLFAGDREPDFAARLRGEKPPLGMLYTIERTRRALLGGNAFYTEIVRPRLQTILAHGTTTLETKTGYALHKPGE